MSTTFGSKEAEAELEAADPANKVGSNLKFTIEVGTLFCFFPKHGKLKTRILDGG